MSKVPQTTPDLPEDVVLRVSNVSKKFCRNLRRSMWYGIQDLSKNLLGFSSNPETADCRPQTADVLGGSASGSEDAEVAPAGGSQGLQSAVCGLQSSQNSDGLRPAEFWALRDISFDLKRGECLGLIGRNGCGKTTLLRLIAGIFPPDRGEIAIRGRVGALIALGAGFHPHMTGRENVYLNGAILGLHKKEIDAQFDEIVEFAEIGEFIDAPVSTYSSGMRVRLGFAVATAVKPDLLLVDEILAVGDSNFQAKCFQRLGTNLNGCAVILVTHNPFHVKKMCDRVLLLDHGNVVGDGRTETLLRKYEEENQVDNLEPLTILDDSIKSACIDLLTQDVSYGDCCEFRLTIEVNKLVNCDLSYLNIADHSEVVYAQVELTELYRDYPVGALDVLVRVGPLYMATGTYVINIFAASNGGKKTIFQLRKCAQFFLEGASGMGPQFYPPVVIRIQTPRQCDMNQGYN